MVDVNQRASAASRDDNRWPGWRSAKSRAVIRAIAGIAAGRQRDYEPGGLLKVRVSGIVRIAGVSRPLLSDSPCHDENVNRDHRYEK